MSGSSACSIRKSLGMCGSRGTLNWSRTLRNTGRHWKRATLTSNFFSRRGGFGEKRACNESLGTSASPLATRQRRRCGACATSQQPGHSTMRTPEGFVHSLSLLDGCRKLECAARAVGAYRMPHEHAWGGMPARPTCSDCRFHPPTKTGRRVRSMAAGGSGTPSGGL
jgi:hypothetical protein